MFILEGVLKAESQEKTLLFIMVRGQGYAREIANFYEMPLTPIKQQLHKLEDSGLLIAKRIGRTVCFEFNPRYPFLGPLKELLKAALKVYPSDIKKQLVMERGRPRHSKKPVDYVRR